MGTQVQFNGGRGQEFAHTAGGWGAFYSKRPLWATCGRWVDKATSFHLAVHRVVRMDPTLAGPNLREIWALRPQGIDDDPAHGRGTASWAQELWSRAHIPAWDEATLGVWRRWAGRRGRLGAQADPASATLQPRGEKLAGGRPCGDSCISRANRPRTAWLHQAIASTTCGRNTRALRSLAAGDPGPNRKAGHGTTICSESSAASPFFGISERRLFRGSRGLQR